MKKIALVFLIISLNAIAGPCDSEVQKYCSDVKTPGEILKCLAGHDVDLPPTCKGDLQRMAQSLNAATNRGGGAMSSFGGGNAFAPPVPLAIYDHRNIFADGASRLNENKLSLSTPISRTPTESFGISVSGSRLEFGDSSTLSDGKILARNWYRSEIGFQYFHVLPEKKNWGLKTSVGFSTDHVSGKDLSYSLNAFYGFPADSPNGYWVLFAYLSNNSGIANGVPFPGFMYFYKTANFTGMFGFPVASMQWTPANRLSFSFSFFGPNLTTEIAYGSVDTYQIFTGYQWSQQNFIPHERTEDKDRLIVEEQKAMLGIRTPHFSMFAFELQGGRAFGRRLIIGQSAIKHDGGKTRLDADFYGSASLRAAF